MYKRTKRQTNKQRSNSQPRDRYGIYTIEVKSLDTGQGIHKKQCENRCDPAEKKKLSKIKSSSLSLLSLWQSRWPAGRASPSRGLTAGRLTDRAGLLAKSFVGHVSPVAVTHPLAMVLVRLTSTSTSASASSSYRSQSCCPPAPHGAGDRLAGPIGYVWRWQLQGDVNEARYRRVDRRVGCALRNSWHGHVTLEEFNKLEFTVVLTVFGILAVLVVDGS